MDNTWYENLPGTFVLLHQMIITATSNTLIVEDEDVKKKYLGSILYEGELDTHLYNRFMLIGVTMNDVVYIEFVIGKV